jgi:Uma2 family endonuclease
MDDAVHPTLLNPRVIIEVLSDSTEKYDRGVKFDHYRKIPTLQEFVLVSQDRVLIERYVRQAETWILTVFDDADATFSFASIPVQTLVADVYENVAFDSNSTRIR